MRKLPLLLALLLLPLGCHHNGPEPRTPVTPPAVATTQTPPGEPRFEDISARAGITWVHNPCRTGKKLLPETVGGGGGFLDYNRDGRLDVLLINGAPLPGYHGPTPHSALYHNNGDGTFTDVTREAGLTMRE